jgi:hypothetical protein
MWDFGWSRIVLYRKANASETLKKTGHDRHFLLSVSYKRKKGATRQPEPQFPEIPGEPGSGNLPAAAHRHFS